MKKILIIALICIFLAPQIIFAAPKESSADHYYYTDIKTYFFGAPITAYNLGGRTAIVCEDLNWHYGHSVYWYADERKLTVDKNDDGQFTSLQALAGQTLKAQSGKPGKIAGGIYNTDIKTYLNDKPIESYNIGGQTVIICEDMRKYGYDVEWDENKRTLSITGNNSNFKMESDIGTVTRIFNANGIGGGDALFTYQLTVDGRPVDIYTPYSLRFGLMQTLYYRWVPLAPTLDALGAEYEWNAALNKFTITSFDPGKIKTAEPMQSEFISYLGESCQTVELRLYYKDEEMPTTITMQKGHMHNVYEETLPVNAVVRDGVVYLPLKTITDCLGLELTTDEEENIIIPK